MNCVGGVLSPLLSNIYLNRLDRLPGIEAGALAEQRLETAFAQLGADRFGAPVLPDDRGVDRLAGTPVLQFLIFAAYGTE